MRRLQQYLVICVLLMGLGVTSAYGHDDNGKGKSKGKSAKVKKNKNVTRVSISSECRKNMTYVRRHIRRIVQQEAQRSNMSGPVRVSSTVTECGPGESVTIASRCTVNGVRYTLHCELRRTDKNANSPVGWMGYNHVWQRRTARIITPPPPSPTPTPAPNRPTR